jgi:phospholipase C
VPAPAPLTPRPHWTRRLIAFFVERRQQHFNFRMLGVRVPGVVISPWIEPGTVDPTVYDHTSVVATLRKLFPLKSDRLTDRDFAANPFDHLVEARTSPRTDPELPDLSPDLAAGLRAQVEERVGFEGLAMQQEERDTFDRQLRALADLVDQRLATMPPSAAERTFGPLAASQDPRIAADRHGDVIGRFTARAAEARRG